MLSPKIRIGDVEYVHSGPEPSELTYATTVYAIWTDVGLCIEHWLEVELELGRRNVAAGLIFNPATHAMWTNIGNGYGTGLTKTVLRDLRVAEKHLMKARLFSEKDTLQADSFRRSAMNKLGGLPSPLCLLMRTAVQRGEDEVLHTISYMTLLLQEYLAEPTHDGNERAKWTALCLRAIFEEYSDVPITSGRMEQVPSGVFCKCLEQIYAIVGLTCDFRHFADFAKDTAADDETLLTMRYALTLDLSDDEIKKMRSFSD